MQFFDANNVECYILALPTVEANKGFDLVFEVARHLEKFALNRYGCRIFSICKAMQQLLMQPSTAASVYCAEFAHTAGLGIMLPINALPYLVQAQRTYHCNWGRRMPRCRGPHCQPIPPQHPHHQGRSMIVMHKPQVLLGYCFKGSLASS